MITLYGILFQTLLLSKGALFQLSIGHVIDLVSNDVQRLEGDAVKIFFCVSLTALEVVVASWLLNYLIGWQALMGVTFLVFPYFIGLSTVSASPRTRIATVTDQRLSLINQVISGIRAIKEHAWEDEYRAKIKAIRRYYKQTTFQCYSRF